MQKENLNCWEEATPDWKSETEKKTHKYENPRTRIILLNLSDNQR